MKRTARLALRNQGAILEALGRALPEGGRLLELGSGTGEHAVAAARAWPALTIQPSDPDPEARASIAAWAAEAALPNLRPPLDLALGEPAWRRQPCDAVLCVNVLHVAPPEAGLALVDGAAALPPGGALVLYGPFREEGPPPPRLVRFDAELRAHDARLGVRDLGPLLAAAAVRGLLVEARASGAEEGDVLLLLRRAGPGRR